PPCRADAGPEGDVVLFAPGHHFGRGPAVRRDDVLLERSEHGLVEVGGVDGELTVAHPTGLTAHLERPAVLVFGHLFPSVRVLAAHRERQSSRLPATYITPHPAAECLEMTAGHDGVMAAGARRRGTCSRRRPTSATRRGLQAGPVAGRPRPGGAPRRAER